MRVAEHREVILALDAKVPKHKCTALSLAAVIVSVLSHDITKHRGDVEHEEGIVRSCPMLSNGVLLCRGQSAAYKHSIDLFLEHP